MKKITALLNTKLILICFIGVAIFLHIFKFDQVPPGFNADEAAYGYNAYAILKTGKDEFGNSLPLLRLQSFGDYKLPMYTYLTVPAIALLGLNEFSVRLPALLSAVVLVWVMYALAKELFGSESTAVFAAGLTTFSVGIHTLSRHALEVVPATTFIALAFLFLLYFRKNKRVRDASLFILFLSLSLYTYHIARVFYVFFIGAFIYCILKTKIKLRALAVPAAIFIFFLAPFLYAEFTTPPSRLGSLFILNHQGVDLKAQELKIESGRSPFSQKLFVAADEIARRYIGYFSADFLTYKSDPNHRFGFDGLGPMNIVEYLLVLVGLVYLFRKKLRDTAVILLLLALAAPLPAALTWQEYSIHRAYFMFIPLLLIASYGAAQLIQDTIPYKKIVLTTLAFAYLGYTLQRWEFFFFHYPRRATVVRSWQAGYKTLVQEVGKRYEHYEKFYITPDNGQPYIFFLFYLQYPPEKFQRVAKITPPDEYGYTQINGFDKFIFDTGAYNKDILNKKVLYVFSQSQGQNYGLPQENVQKVTVGTEEMFWINTQD